jgi:hypothetical protein
MPRPKADASVNKSEEIRKLLRENPKLSAKEVVQTLAGRGITVGDTLVYFVKGHMKGKKGRRKKARQMVANVAAVTNGLDPVATILKVKGLASDLGGVKKLKALVDALSQ